MFKWPNKFETDRLLLIPIKRATMLQLIKGERPDISKHHPHPQWPLPILIEALPVMANDLMDEPSLLGWHAWFVALKEEGTIIGDVGFKGPPDTEGTVKVAYSTIPAYRKNGYAKETVEAVSNAASKVPEVKRIIAEVLALNVPSIKLLQNLGWEHVRDNEEMEVWEYPMCE